jgi:hypothetical protein
MKMVMAATEMTFKVDPVFIPGKRYQFILAHGNQVAGHAFPAAGAGIGTGGSRMDPDLIRTE